MALSSVVAVADNLGIDTSGVTFWFTPGDPYPPAGQVQLSIRNQPFLPQEPSMVVPAVTSVSFAYGAPEAGVQPPPLIPQDHYLRELFYDTSYRQGSWSVSGNTATLLIDAEAGLRDNSPSGDSPPDDAFRCVLQVRAICIWTQPTPSLIDQIVRDFRRVIRF
ncbi:MAG TPA: hypothetical protein VGL44_03000 [Gaiellales bacterium]|jgi:hypothetical protein